MELFLVVLLIICINFEVVQDSLQSCWKNKHKAFLCVIVLQDTPLHKKKKLQFILNISCFFKYDL